MSRSYLQTKAFLSNFHTKTLLNYHCVHTCNRVILFTTILNVILFPNELSQSFTLQHVPMYCTPATYKVPNLETTKTAVCNQRNGISAYIKRSKKKHYFFFWRGYRASCGRSSIKRANTAATTTTVVFLGGSLFVSLDDNRGKPFIIVFISVCLPHRQTPR